MNDLVVPKNAFRVGGREQVKLGEWRWVQCDEWNEVTKWVNGQAVGGKGHKVTERLMCAFHLASNHVKFHQSYPGGGDCIEDVRYRDIEAKTRLEPNWQAELQKQIAAKQLELSAAINTMIDLVKSADLLNESNEPPTLLPSTVRRDPVAMKAELLRLKKVSYPAAQANVETVIKEMVALNKDMCLSFKADAERMDAAVKTVDKRLFALEIYAGIGEGSVLIREGKPAEPETPITVRQMIRYMDEETLIDLDKGGMDFTKVDEFDEWVSRPENIARMAPETRCVVALQVRREDKDYGDCHSIGEAIAHVEWNRKNNKWTYLLIRNGEQIWRLMCDIEFSPRLLPLREEFVAPLVKEPHYSFDNREPELITPDHLEYDEHLAERMHKVYEYNRVMFLLQGLLDRSKVFAPHPPINLADEAQVEKYFKPVFDEEQALPSANPPVWEVYRNKINKTIKPGTLVWCNVGEEASGRYTRDRYRPKYGYDAPKRPIVCEVERVSKDRKHVVLKWSLGPRTKVSWRIDMQRPVPNKPHYYYKSRHEDVYEERFGHQKVEMEKVFAVAAYTPGDYKKFLCDAYLKGAYLQWAPQLIGAEKWHQAAKATKAS